MATPDAQAFDPPVFTTRAAEALDARFRCPRCNGPLNDTRSALRCKACDASYPVREGVLDFRCGRHDYYFNPVPRQEMAQLIRDAGSVPWDDTVRRFLRHVRKVPAWIDNVAVNGRYAWKLFLELRPESRVLDLGCGLGNLTRNLAPHVGEVVALDLTWERLLFAQRRFAKFNAGDRITLVAGGDGTHLPFPDGHFDCIALSGVLEWIADDPSLYAGVKSPAARALKMMMTFFGETNPRATQLRFLQELHRILKPDGQLFVAIENRWSYEYFAGRPDHHSRLKYGSLLPRFVANLYSIALRRRPYRTYTYRLPEFRRLFTAAGFPRQECLGLSPGYSGLEAIFPCEGDQPFWRDSRPASLAERIRRSPRFVPAFGMLARSSAERRKSLLERVLDEVSATLPGQAGIELDACEVARSERIVLCGRAGVSRIVIRIPVDGRARALEDNNLRILQILAKRPHTFAPEPLAHGVQQGLAYYVERTIEGQPLGSQASLTRASASAAVAELFARMHAQGQERAMSSVADADLSERLIAAPMEKLRAAGVDAPACGAFERRLRDELAGRRWTIGLCHGNFTCDNLVATAQGIAGVTDWTYATERGLPALDAISYVESMQRRACPTTLVGANLLQLARWDWPSNEEMELLRTYYREWRLDEAAHALLCRLTWLQSMARMLDTPARLDFAFVERNTTAMLSAPAAHAPS
jgi:SAM-dependent methyltransferase